MAAAAEQFDEQGAWSIAPGNTNDAHAGVESMFELSTFEPQSFEEAVKALKLPNEDEVVSACAEVAEEAVKSKKMAEQVTVEDAKFLALLSFDFGAGSKDRLLNPHAQLNQALSQRTALQLRGVCGVLYGVLRALRKLPRTEHDVLC